MDQVFLAGPPATIARLAALAADLRLAHVAADGVLRLATADAWSVAAHAPTVVAPLESTLVRMVHSTGSDAADLAAASVAPTLGELVARQRHGALLDALAGRTCIHVGFQPVVDLASGAHAGYEALLRVRLAGRDVPPAEVLAAAEESGRLVEVDAAAREVAVDEAAPNLGQRRLFLNIAPSSLPMPADVLGPFAEHLVRRDLRTAQVVLEAPVGPVGILRRHLAVVFEVARELGFAPGLDNVRSERDLEVSLLPDVVKLDRSLVRGLSGSSAARALGAIVRECEHAGVTVVAQGIENEDQLRAVRDLGVRCAQGWHLGRPGRMPSESGALAS